MKHSAKKLLALLVLSGLMLLALSGAALAGPPWSDASSTWWTTNYGVGDTEVATVADGYPDGTFRPGLAVTRGQFAKMAVSGLGIETARPAKATFVDVIPSNTMFPYIEGAYTAGLIGGYPTGGQLYFKPGTKIQRQHANTILGRYLSQLEIDITGAIHGDVGNYGSLDGWYAAEGSFYLNGFGDAKYVQSAHRATTAYLVFRGILKGSNSRLNPTATLIRAQAAALILRVKAEAEAIKTPPTAPTNLSVIATGTGASVAYNPSTQQYLGNDSTPQITGDTIAGRPIAIYDSGNKLVEDSSNSAGKFYTDITVALTDGLHIFTAKVKNANGLVSPASLPVTYVLDTVQPSVSIGVPTVPSGQTTAVIKALKPDFTAIATDSGSGVKQVEFQFAVKQTTLVWQTISVDTIADSGNNLYTAVWPSSGPLSAGLADGQYVFRVVATDNAGNQRISATVDVIVDNSLPTVTITSPLPMASGIFYTESITPTFTAVATDPVGANQQSSGIASVQFYYAVWTPTGKPTTWSGFTLISTDTTPDYAAVYAAALPEGRYIFAVKAVDKVGNESALMNGSAYAAGVTQEVVIDKTAPVVSITSPSGQSFQKGQSITITWSLTDAMPPDTVRLSYTLDGSVVAPAWVDIAPTTENDGLFQWMAPDITGDKIYARIRIIAVDKAGELVGNVTGHTTTALSSYFTIYDIPAAVTNLTAVDADFNNGVDGRDFQAMWTPSVSTDILSQKVYLLPAGATSLNFTSDHPVATFNNNTTATWIGLETMTTDSRNGVLGAGSYRIWVVVADTGGHIALTASDAFDVVAP